MSATCMLFIYFFPMGLKADSSPLLVQVTPKAEAVKFCLIKGRVVIMGGKNWVWINSIEF